MSYVAFQYSEALFSLALERNELDKVLSDLNNFVSSLDTDIYIFLNHPKITKTNKKEVLKVSINNELLLHFVYVIIDNLRVDLFDDIYEEFKKLYDNQNKILRVKAYLNRKLSTQQEENLKKSLQKKLNRNVELISIVDKSIVGGMRVEYEGMIHDNTINNYLHSLKANLLK